MGTIGLDVTFFVEPDTRVKWRKMPADEVGTIRVVEIGGGGDGRALIHLYGNHAAAADRLIAVLTELRDDALAEARARELAEPVPA